MSAQWKKKEVGGLNIVQLQANKANISFYLFLVTTCCSTHDTSDFHTLFFFIYLVFGSESRLPAKLQVFEVQGIDRYVLLPDISGEMVNP